METQGYEVKLAARIWTSEFYSEGPKGAHQKSHSIYSCNVDGNTFFNLCFRRLEH